MSPLILAGLLLMQAFGPVPSGNWTVSGATNDSGRWVCTADVTYNSGTTLVFTQASDFFGLYFSNPVWQLPSGATYDVSLSVDQRYRRRWTAETRGVDSIVIGFDGIPAELRQALRFGDTLRVDGEVEAQYFSLHGTNRTLQLLDQCVHVPQQRNPFGRSVGTSAPQTSNPFGTTTPARTVASTELVRGIAQSYQDQIGSVIGEQFTVQLDADGLFNLSSDQLIGASLVLERAALIDTTFSDADAMLSGYALSTCDVSASRVLLANQEDEYAIKLLLCGETTSISILSCERNGYCHFSSYSPRARNDLFDPVDLETLFAPLIERLGNGG